MSFLFDTIYKSIIENAESTNKHEQTNEQSQFYIPNNNENFEKLIQISKDQLANNNNEIAINQSKLYYQGIRINRYIREPCDEFLIPPLTTAINNEDLEKTNNDIHMRNKLAIINHIKDTNSIFFNAFYDDNLKLDYKYKCVQVDGTCSVGKTTILSLLNSHGIHTGKTNDMMFTINFNTHTSYSLGYSYESLKLMEKNENTVWDRSPHNNILWFTIWCLISKTEKVKELDESHFYMFRSILESDQSNILEKIFLTCSPSIIIINSDEDYCKQKLQERNTGSDRERASWPHYITIQNFAYGWLASKFPDKIILIDIAHYLNHINGHRLLQEAVVDIIKEILPKLNHVKTFCNEQLNRHNISYFYNDFHTSNKLQPVLMAYKMKQQKDCVIAIKQQCIKHGIENCTVEKINEYFNDCIEKKTDIVDRSMLNYKYENNDNGDIIENVNDGILHEDDLISIEF